MHETEHGTTFIPEDLSDSVSFPASEAQQRFRMFHNVLQLPLFATAHTMCTILLQGHSFGLLVPSPEDVDTLYRKGLYALPQAGPEFCTQLWESPLHKNECHLNRYKKIERSIHRKIPSTARCSYAGMHCATYIPVHDEQQFYGLLQMLTMRLSSGKVKLKASAADAFVKTVKRQADDSLAKLPVAEETIQLPAWLWLLERLRDDLLFAFAQPVPDSPATASHRHIRSRYGPLAAASSEMNKSLDLIDHALQHERPMLFSGPTGCGKRTAAQTLHTMDRPTTPFLNLDCATLNPGWMAVTLFGDDEQKDSGYIHRVQSGTLCLRNLEALDVDNQERLVKVLTQHNPDKLTQNSAFRLVATTSDIDALESTLIDSLIDIFQDNVIEIPPLSERIEDIPIIVDQELDNIDKEIGTSLAAVPDAVLEKWQQQDWPGDVTQLRQEIFDYAIGHAQVPALQALPDTGENGLEATIAAIEKSVIQASLNRHGWVAENAGAGLGLTRDQVRRRMKKYKITKPARKRLPEIKKI